MKKYQEILELEEDRIKKLMDEKNYELHRQGLTAEFSSKLINERFLKLKEQGLLDLYDRLDLNHKKKVHMAHIVKHHIESDSKLDFYYKMHLIELFNCMGLTELADELHYDNK